MNTTNRSPGFTLVEVVVALALTTLVALGLTTALKTVADSGRRVEAAILENEALEAVSSFIGFAIETASTKPVAAGDGRPQALYFQGRPEALEWLGVLPARHGLGGLHFLRLEVVEQKEGRRALVLSYLPFRSSPALLDWSQAETYPLLRDVGGFRVAYQGREEAEWIEEWVAQPVLPGKVGLSVQIPGRMGLQSVFSVFAGEKRPLQVPMGR